MTNAEKVRENRLRRAAKRQGKELIKSRLRDPKAIGFGLYRLKGMFSSTDLTTIDQIEEFLR